MTYVDQNSAQTHLALPVPAAPDAEIFLHSEDNPGNNFHLLDILVRREAHWLQGRLSLRGNGLYTPEIQLRILDGVSQRTEYVEVVGAVESGDGPMVLTFQKQIKASASEVTTDLDPTLPVTVRVWLTFNSSASLNGVLEADSFVSLTAVQVPPNQPVEGRSFNYAETSSTTFVTLDGPSTDFVAGPSGTVKVTIGARAARSDSYLSFEVVDFGTSNVVVSPDPWFSSDGGSRTLLVPGLVSGHKYTARAMYKSATPTVSGWSGRSILVEVV